MNSTNQNLVLTDDYRIFDKLSEMSRKNPRPGPIGWVRAFLQKKGKTDRELFFEGSNMVVAQGRYFVAQKIFGIGDTGTDYRDYLITHFSVGAGGATVDGDAVTLLGPHICDTSVYKPIGLGSTHNEPGMYDNSSLSDDLKELYTSYGAVRPIDSVTLVEEDYEETGVPCQYKTKVKCECIVGPGDPPALQINGYVPISEAGLYFVHGNDAKLFAHVCFPPKYKELESTLIIDWYVLC